MASTSSDGLPCYPAAPASTLLDVQAHHHRQLYVDPAAAATTSFFPATTDAQAEAQPLPPATVPRKPRKRARASRRATTTVLTTDATNFRAMVQEFTGFPAPPFAPHLGQLSPGAVLFGAGTSPSGSVGGAPFHHQLLRPSPLKLSASPHGPPPPSCTIGNTSSFAHTLLAPSLSSESYVRFGPTFAAGAVPIYGEGFAAAMAGKGVEHGHDLATSFLHAEDRYHDH
jgi:hypothetical protein